MATDTNVTGLPVKWRVDNNAGLVALTVAEPEVGYYAYSRTTQLLYQARTAGSGAGVWSSGLTPGYVASSVNYLELGGATTGVNPTITTESEANTGLIIQNNESEEIVIFECVATPLNEITISNAATGENPLIAATGQANSGIDFENSEGEELMVMECVATAVNHITITNAATNTNPVIASSGEADTGIDFENDQAEMMLRLEPTATAVNYVLITSAATNTNPTIASAGATADTGLEFENEQGETMLILECVASGDNYITITNGADHPEIAGLGAGTNVNVEVIPKGAGYLDIQGGRMDEAVSLTPDDSEGAGVNMIAAGVKAVDVGANVNGVTDYLVLPPIADVNVGDTITICCNGGANFELRTPASSNTPINNVDSDGDQELLCTDTTIVVCRKISTNDGWQATEFPIAGGVSAAVTPD